MLTTERDDLEFLFVVTYGRSGSTLLMGVLDSLPGFCVRGENRGVVYDLFQYHSKAMTAREQWTRDEPLAAQHAWYGIDQYPPEIATGLMRQLVLETLLRPEPDTRVTGFKEIRWWMPRPVQYLDFIETLFPGARFVLNTRNLDDVANSRWWRKKPNARADLENVENRLREAVGKRGDRGYHVHYDDYADDPAALQGMCDWLGVEYDEQRVREVLGRTHSSITKR